MGQAPSEVPGTWKLHVPANLWYAATFRRVGSVKHEETPASLRSSQPGDTVRPDQAGAASTWWILVAVGVGTFMSALDGSVVNITLPVIQLALGTEVATIEWVIIIYLLVVSGLLLSVGRLGDMRGHKWVYIAGFAGFGVGSALCGLAPFVAALIGFRGLQAVGAAMLFANGPAILTKNFPAHRRGQVLGLQATMTYLGLTVGPSLGGWVTSQFGWRAIFYINVPVAVLAVLLSVRFIPADPPAEHVERFDLKGAATFCCGLVALLLGLNQGNEWGWTSPGVGGAFGSALVLLAAFVVIERRVLAPMLDLSLFRKRLFSAATTSALLNYICLYSVLFLLPFYLIDGRGFDSAYAGLLLTAQPIIMAIAAPLSGTLSDRIGSRLPGTLGMLLMGAGLFLLSRIGPESPAAQIMLGLAVVGLGTGTFISPNTSALMGAAPCHRQGVASGVLATARNVGMVLGVGLAGAVFTTALAGHADPGSTAALFGAVQAGLLMASGVALLGAAVSAVRGS